MVDGDEAGLLNRLERHFRVKKYSRYVQSIWGKKGLEEYRHHLSDDIKAFIASFGTVAAREMMKQITQTPRSRSV